MSVDLLAEINDQNDPLLQNWFNIQNLILPHFGPRLLDISQAHSSTFFKIKFADYHLFILQQIYHPNTSMRAGAQQWARAEMHSIIFNLYSALDSLGNEINLAYGFGIPTGKIHIHHDHRKKDKDCLRCRIDNENDSVGSYLKCSLRLHWFDIFRKLRNQITHKDLPVLQTVMVDGNITKFKIPNDPTNSDPKEIDYSDNLELKQYCVNTRMEVLKITEYIYSLIKPLIKARIRRYAEFESYCRSTIFLIYRHVSALPLLDVFFLFPMYLPPSSPYSILFSSGSSTL